MAQNIVPKGIDIIAAAMLVIGGLNWGFIGFFNINPVEFFFGAMSPASRILYVLVGLAALYDLFMWRSILHRWGCALWHTSPGKSAA